MTWEYSVQVSVSTILTPPSLLFSWPQDLATLPDYYTVSRKAPNAPNWGPAVMLPGSATSYVDANVVPGTVYEYQFFKSTTNHVGYGYVTAGILIPPVEQRGKILLLVDQSFSLSLRDELARLRQDLVGDGWMVLRHEIPRDAAVADVKAIIKADYDSDPSNVAALLLFGRIPVPYSGDSAPDGHPDYHKGAWPADSFYGDMTGLWTDQSVNDVTASDPRNRNVPGDGKFDQSEIPGRIQLQIGRVDLANMPGVETNGVPVFPEESELLRQYLNKDHRYRHKMFSLPARGLVFNATGDREGEAFAADAWRNYAPLLGPPPARPLLYDEFIPILRTNGYQWAYASSGGGPTGIFGLGGIHAGPNWGDAHWGLSLDFVELDIQTCFVMLLGSGLGDWDTQDNIMRSVLATPTYGLASVYAGRPHWYFHPMGMGATLGECARLTQNNHADGLYRNESNNFAGFTHIALLGDPTLRLHPVAPPAGLKALRTPQGVQLSWSPAPDDVLGYRIYRAANEAGPFTRLSPENVVGTSFLDSAPGSDNAIYMVRAIKLQSSPSGSYFNLSQGVFANVQAELSLQVAPSGDVTLTFGAAAGQVYRILWSDSITNSAWAPLSQDMLATGSIINCCIGSDGAISGTGWAATNIFSTGAPVIWADDALPTGAIPGVGGDPWQWIASNPAPFSGALAVQSTSAAGLHQLYYTSPTTATPVGTDDILFAYVYLDPANLPQEIMLQWNDGLSWEHRAFWGSNLITWGENGTASRIYQGPLPPAGKWFRLQAAATDVGLAGSSISGLAFSQYDGRATWDFAGKSSRSASMTFTAARLQRFFKVVSLP